MGKTGLGFLCQPWLQPYIENRERVYLSQQLAANQPVIKWSKAGTGRAACLKTPFLSLQSTLAVGGSLDLCDWSIWEIWHSYWLMLAGQIKTKGVLVSEWQGNHRRHIRSMCQLEIFDFTFSALLSIAKHERLCIALPLLLYHIWFSKLRDTTYLSSAVLRQKRRRKTSPDRFIFISRVRILLCWKEEHIASIHTRIIIYSISVFILINKHYREGVDTFLY